MIEQTLVLIKPDGVQKNMVGKIIERFESQGLRIRDIKMDKMTQDLLNTWYSQYTQKPFFAELSKFMMETPVVAIIFSGENAVSRVRDLIGPTDSTLAPKGTIRGDWGESKQKNLVHASDGVERAKFEIELLFGKNCDGCCC